MPRLLGTMARTAVVAGTARATANAVDRRQAQKNVAAYEQAGQQVYAQQAPPAQAAPPAAAAPAESMDEKLAQLERLGQLKAQGILTEEEFARQKAAILGSKSTPQDFSDIAGKGLKEPDGREMAMAWCVTS